MTMKPAITVADVKVDFTLLNLAAELLRESDITFTVELSEFTSFRIPWLLAENSLFVLGIVAAESLDELVALEAHATSELTERLQAAGPKRWDAYLVLLANDDGEMRGSRVVRSLQYNTRLVRRIVSLGIRSSEQNVRRALSIFLPLPPQGKVVLRSAFDDLVDELEIQGIDRRQAISSLESLQLQHGIQ